MEFIGGSAPEGVERDDSAGQLAERGTQPGGRNARPKAQADHGLAGIYDWKGGDPVWPGDGEAVA
ncbi:hypothetical protein D9M72_637770 [compost metagenome]